MNRISAMTMRTFAPVAAAPATPRKPSRLAMAATAMRIENPLDHFGLPPDVVLTGKRRVQGEVPCGEAEVFLLVSLRTATA